MARIGNKSGGRSTASGAPRSECSCFIRAIRVIRGAICLGLLVVLAGCRSNNRVSLDPLNDKSNPAAADPLRGGAPKPSGNAPPAGQARLMAPELDGGMQKLTDTPSATLGGPTMAALASKSGIGLESPKGAAGVPGNSRSAVWTPSSGSITMDQAKEQLKARGVTWHQLEMGSDGLWHFRCTMPDPENPGVSRVYETSDTSDLNAVKKALANLGS